MRFIKIYENLLSEGFDYTDSVHLNKTVQVKDKTPKKFAAIMGKKLVLIAKPVSTKGSIFVAGSAGDAKTVYAKDDEGNIYELFNVPKNIFSLYGEGDKKIKKGEKSTKVHESAVCHFLALALSFKLTSARDILDYMNDSDESTIIEDLKKLSNRFDTNGSINETAELVKESESWAKSTAAKCARIIKEFRIPSNMVFHRGSSIASAIDSKGLELCNKAGANYTKKDRWNPADIWIINKGSDVTNNILNSTSINELNSILNSNLKKGKFTNIVGISLKKSKYPNAPLNYYNMKAGESDMLVPDTLGAGKSKTAGMTKSTDIIDSDEGLKMELRPTGSGPSVISANFKKLRGSTAQAGSVTITALFKHNKAVFPVLSKEAKDYFTYKGNATPKFYEEFRKLMYDVLANARRLKISKLNGVIFKIKSKKSLDDFMIATLNKYNGDVNKAVTTLYTKLQGLHLVAIMKQDTMDMAWQQASNQTDFAPRFIKVGEE